METTPARNPEPQKKASPAFLAVCAVILVFAVGLRLKDAFEIRNPVMTEATLRGRTFTVEVADTIAKRELGLGERDTLPRDHGMYFPFGEEGRWVFWMKGMRFPIDIIWLRGDVVVGIERSVPVPTSLPLDTYSPDEPADGVLEVNAGVASELGLRPGDRICFGACEPADEPAAIVMEKAPEAPPPDVKTYADEDAAPGTYANAELGMGFSYPEAWGDAALRESTFKGFDTGRRATASFTGNASATFDVFSPDWAIGVGEGWGGRLQVSGDPKDPIGTLAEAKRRVHEDVAAFRKVGDGYLFGFRYAYGANYLLAVFLAPNLLTGDYADVQWVARRGEPIASKGPDEPPFTDREAAAALAKPEIKAELDVLESVFRTIRPLAPAP